MTSQDKRYWQLVVLCRRLIPQVRALHEEWGATDHWEELEQLSAALPPFTPAFETKDELWQN